MYGARGFLLSTMNLLFIVFFLFLSNYFHSIAVILLYELHTSVNPHLKYGF